MTDHHIVRSKHGRVDTWVSFDVRRAYARNGGELIVASDGVTWRDPETGAFHRLSWEEFAEFMRNVGSPVEESQARSARQINRYTPRRTLHNPYGRSGEGLMLD